MKQAGILVLAVMLCVASLAQAPATGAPPFGTVVQDGFSIVDIANLNLHFGIPIIHKAGRGIPFDYVMGYDSSVWYPVTSSGHESWQPVGNWGWQGQTEAAVGYVHYTEGPVQKCQDPINGLEAWVTLTFDSYHDERGVSHPIHAVLILSDPGTCAPPPLESETVTTKDGSDFSIYVDDTPSATVTSRSGTVSVVPVTRGSIFSATVTDTNGNQMKSTASTNLTFTDTLGGTVLTVSGTGTTTSPLVFSYTAPSGGAANVTFNYSSYTVKTNFGAVDGTGAAIAEYGPSAQNLVSSIVLADGTTYQVTYEATPGFAGDVTGRVVSINLPTGGSYTYTYTGGYQGILNDGSTAGLTDAINDLVHTHTWTYTRSGAQTTVTDPDGDDTTYTFAGLYETNHTVYQGSSGTGTKLSWVDTCWNGVCFPTSVTLPVTQHLAYFHYNSSFYSAVTTNYDATTQLLTSKYDYDFPNAALKRITTISYAALGNIVDHPAQVNIEDASGAVKAQTKYQYDQTGVTATTGTPEHVAVSGSRGNPTEVDSLVSGTTYLTQRFSYYDTGTTNTATDVNGAVTTYTYGTGSCGNSFPTSVSLPLGLSNSSTWNCTGAVSTSSTDANGKTTNVAWTDPHYWVPNSATDPLGSITNMSYSHIPQLVTSSTLDFNTSSSEAGTVSTTDGVGRVHYLQQRQSPTSVNYDSVQIGYDDEGRQYRTTMAYVAAKSTGQPSSTPYTYTTFDAMNRPTKVYEVESDGTSVLVTQYTYNVNDVLIEQDGQPAGENPKKRQYEYDGLGRLTSVCEITSGTGSSACGQQNNSVSGYTTSYSYSLLDQLTGVNQSGQTRSYVYDDLGRMTSETNPENGTTNYAYDTVPSPCAGSGGASAGDLTRIFDGAGNTKNCYYHDALHRLTDAGFSGPTCRRLRYDSQTVNGIAMANSKGRLARAYTDNCGSTTLTDEGFSYDADGRITDFYESTPNSGGFYHLSGTYWSHGLLNTFSMPGISALPTFTYAGLDGEGRPTTVTASSGQSPVVKSVTYENTDPGTSNEPVGSLLSLTVGSNDSDAFQFDKNNGRMTQYQFNVGTKSEVGNLTWNPNGSLGSLGITDPFNSTDTQTCTYGYDDLMRVSNANCGTVWNQTFSYDAFGNLSKSGSSSFQPSYNSVTNHFTLSGTTVSYDNYGDLTNDSAHTYSWDGFGTPTAIDSVALTYDALGRMVEQASGSTFTQVLYGLGGTKLGQMRGQTIRKLYIPLIGGTVGIYGSSGLLYYRHADWLGSTRVASTPTQTESYGGAHAPFGEPYAENGSDERTFTGMKQETVSGLYDFEFRELSSSQGRWVSPDPAALGAVDMSNPQSWNRYSYVENSPLNAIDLLGLQVHKKQGGIPPNYDPTTALDLLLDAYENAQTYPYIQYDSPESMNITDLGIITYYPTMDAFAFALVTQLLSQPGNVQLAGLSRRGMNFIHNCEGFSGSLYNDMAGNCTIGYGHLLHLGNCTSSDPYQGGTSEINASVLAYQDTASAEKAVINDVAVDLSQSQFDALTSFTFNEGAGTLGRSTLLSDLNAGDYNAVPTQLARYAFAGHKFSSGLATRRAAEGAMFSNGVYGSCH